MCVTVITVATKISWAKALQEKAHVAASMSLEAPFVWIKSITVWPVVVRKASLLEGKVCDSASKPFVDYNCLSIKASSYSLWLLLFFSNNSALLQHVRQQHNSTICTQFQGSCLLLHELFPSSQQSINVAAGKACTLHFFTWVKASPLVALTAVTWIACLHDRGRWAANTNPLLNYWFCWRSPCSSPLVTSRHTTPITEVK